MGDKDNIGGPNPIGLTASVDPNLAADNSTQPTLSDEVSEG
jgi:hypothetical protein